jgi:peptide/nickel transport system substrate-binding protein
VDTATVLVEQLKKVGVTAKIKEVKWNTWLNDVYGKKKYEATVIGFDAANLSAPALLDRYRSDAPNNMFNYNNKEYDETYAKAAAATDDAEATALYKDCEKILADTAANVYLMDLPLFVAVRTGLEGYEFYPLYVQDFSTLKWAE